VDEQRLSEKLDAVEKEAQRVGHEYQTLLRQNNSGGASISWSELSDAHTQWRYEHPLLSRLLIKAFLLGGVILLLACLWVGASSGIGKAMGLDHGKKRIIHAYYAILWTAKIGDASDLHPMNAESYQGYVERVIDDMMVVSYYKDGAQHRRLIKAANVVIEDKPGFQEWALRYKLRPITLDFYLVLEQAAGHDVWAAVMWLNKEPINVQLVERRLGYPEVSPPTAVVNRIYSQYYWGLAINGKPR